MGVVSLKFLLVSALLPALLLMFYVYRKDTVEKESGRLLLRLFLLGAAACIPASLLETLSMRILDRFMEPGTTRYVVWEAFFIVAVAEEGCKSLALHWGSWRSPEFNYRFDGIVYAVFVGMGFAGFENLLYVLNYGPDVVIARGLLSIPGHMTFAVFMGLYYAQSKMAELYDDGYRRRRNFSMSLLFPIALHGFYDFCLMSQNETLAVVFIIFVIVLDIVSVALIRRYSHRDYPFT